MLLRAAGQNLRRDIRGARHLLQRRRPTGEDSRKRAERTATWRMVLDTMSQSRDIWRPHGAEGRASRGAVLSCSGSLWMKFCSQVFTRPGETDPGHLKRPIDIPQKARDVPRKGMEIKMAMIPSAKDVAQYLKFAKEPDCAGEYGKDAWVHDHAFVTNGADLMRAMRQEIQDLKRKLKGEKRSRKEFASASQGAVARLVTDKMNLEQECKRMKSVLDAIRFHGDDNNRSANWMARAAAHGANKLYPMPGSE